MGGGQGHEQGQSRGTSRGKRQGAGAGAGAEQGQSRGKSRGIVKTSKSFRKKTHFSFFLRMAAAAVSDVPEGMVQSVFMDSLYAYVIRHPSTISA